MLSGLRPKAFFWDRVSDFFFKFKFNYLTYNVLLVSEVEVSDSSVLYNTQCSLHHVPSLISITQLPFPSTPTPPATLSVFPMSLLWLVSLSHLSGLIYLLPEEYQKENNAVESSQNI